MGTRSRIGIQLKDDSILSVYCHWDGYPSFNGKVLREFYDTKEKVNQLINGGNMVASPLCTLMWVGTMKLCLKLVLNITLLVVNRQILED